MRGMDLHPQREYYTKLCTISHRHFASNYCSLVTVSNYSGINKHKTETQKSFPLNWLFQPNFGILRILEGQNFQEEKDLKTI